MKLSYRKLRLPQPKVPLRSQPIINSYPTCAEVGFPELSGEDYEKLAQCLNGPDAIRDLSRINLVLQSGGLFDASFQTELARMLFSSSEFARMQIYRMQTGKVAWTSPYQLRLLISALLRLGGSQGTESIFSPSLPCTVGMALLSSTGVLDSALPVLAPDDSYDRAALLLHLTHASYSNSSRELEQASVKGYLLKQLFSDPEVTGEVEKSLGFSPVAFQTALLAMWSYFARRARTSFAKSGSITVGYDYLMGQALIPKQIGDMILERYCIDLEKLPLGHEKGTLSDLGELAAKPFGIYRGHLVCFDVDFALARVSRELWNISSKTADQTKVPEFKARSGYLFEDYCREILDAIVATRATNGAALCDEELLKKAPLDFLYIEKDVAVAIECKTAPLPTSILYGNDPAALTKAIDDKFVNGTPKDKQGFIQCANHIRTLLADRAKFGLENVKTIIPCLVVMEDWLTYFPAFQLATKLAKPLFADFVVQVGDPVIIHAEDLRMIAERSKFLGLGEALKTIADQDLLQTNVTTKNLINRQWPVTDSNLIEIPQPLDYLDDAKSHLDGNYSPPFSKPCPTCKDELTALVNGKGQRAWFCFQCDRFTDEPYTEEDEANFKAHIKSIAERYRSGT